MFDVGGPKLAPFAHYEPTGLSVPIQLIRVSSTARLNPFRVIGGCDQGAGLRKGGAEQRADDLDRNLPDQTRFDPAPQQGEHDGLVHGLVNLREQRVGDHPGRVREKMVATSFSVQARRYSAHASYQRWFIADACELLARSLFAPVGGIASLRQSALDHFAIPQRGAAVPERACFRGRVIKTRYPYNRTGATNCGPARQSKLGGSLPSGAGGRSQRAGVPLICTAGRR